MSDLFNWIDALPVAYFIVGLALAHIALYTAWRVLCFYTDHRG